MNKKTMIVATMMVMTAILLMPQMAAAQRYRTIELKPITQQGWQYYYDLKKVSSPVAIEIPLLAVNDTEVNHYLKAYKNWNTAAAVVTLVPLVYLLSLPKNGYVEPSTFWWMLGGTLVAQLGMTAVGHVKLGKAIDKYNMLIVQPSGSSLGLQITWKFL